MLYVTIFEWVWYRVPSMLLLQVIVRPDPVFTMLSTLAWVFGNGLCSSKSAASRYIEVSKPRRGDGLGQQL